MDALAWGMDRFGAVETGRYTIVQLCSIAVVVEQVIEMQQRVACQVVVNAGEATENLCYTRIRTARSL